MHNTQANNILDSWVKSFDLEQSSYDSISVFAEVRLKEALAATEELGEQCGFTKAAEERLLKSKQYKEYHEQKEAVARAHLDTCRELYEQARKDFARAVHYEMGNATLCAEN